MKLSSKRAIRLCIEKELPSEGVKYINLLNLFIMKLKEYNCIDEYINLLWQIVLMENPYEPTDDRWKTLIRKKMIAILLIPHYFEENESKTNFPDFFALWEFVFPGNSLP